MQTVREAQKPVHYAAFQFPGLHRSIISFASTGRLAIDSTAYEPAFLALRRTTIGKKYGVTSDSTSGKLYVSSEFMKTVNTSSSRTLDQFQRPVHWILWSTVSEIALIIIPEESELLLPLIRQSKSSPTHLTTYAAPVTRKMLHFDNLQYYAVPSLPPGWEAPLWLRTELGIYSGRLYFEYSEYENLLRFLGIKEEVDDLAPQANSIEQKQETPTIELHVEQEAKAFTRRPLSFLKEWLAVCRKGQDFMHTPMGFVCQGKKLLESHPFFSSNDRNRAKKETKCRKAEAPIGGGKEGEVEVEFSDDGIYGNEAREDVDEFNDAELLDDEGIE